MTSRDAGHRGLGREALLAVLVWLAAVIAILGVCIHIGAILGGPIWYEFFGAPTVVVKSARAGTLLAPLGAVGIAALMACCALLAFSALGVIRRLPLLRPTLALVAFVTLLRSSSLIPLAILKLNLLSTFEVVASMVWGLAGLGFVAAFVIAHEEGPSMRSERSNNPVERTRER